ncbi:hypothetical protein [Marixanthomonas spongiae]|uniref:Lipoprotein n=1 Tax=Marixanthomonas spongiae TaxID=2174845 RepID=A0A2U0HW94_9FLAO|nr:hypothetical protein [Marixanthomonas spongiae]PVW13108.1 hypothetical protein DDV96_14415 [Marixanthomonas spongiae]
MKYIALIFYIILFVSCSTSKFYSEVSSLNDSYRNELVEKYGKDAVKRNSFDPHKLVLKTLKERIQNTDHIIYHYSPLPKWKSKEFAGVVYDVDNSKYYYLENSEERPRKIVVDTVYDYPNDNYYKFIIDNCHVQVISATGQVDFNFSIGLM